MRPKQQDEAFVFSLSAEMLQEKPSYQKIFLYMPHKSLQVPLTGLQYAPDCILYHSEAYQSYTENPSVRYLLVYHKHYELYRSNLQVPVL